MWAGVGARGARHTQRWFTCHSSNLLCARVRPADFAQQLGAAIHANYTLAPHKASCPRNSTLAPHKASCPRNSCPRNSSRQFQRMEVDLRVELGAHPATGLTATVTHMHTVWHATATESPSWCMQEAKLKSFIFYIGLAGNMLIWGSLCIQINSSLVYQKLKSTLHESGYAKNLVGRRAFSDPPKNAPDFKGLYCTVRVRNTPNPLTALLCCTRPLLVPRGQIRTMLRSLRVKAVRGGGCAIGCSGVPPLTRAPSHHLMSPPHTRPPPWQSSGRGPG